MTHLELFTWQKQFYPPLQKSSIPEFRFPNTCTFFLRGVVIKKEFRYRLRTSYEVEVLCRNSYVPLELLFECNINVYRAFIKGTYSLH